LSAETGAFVLASIQNGSAVLVPNIVSGSDAARPLSRSICDSANLSATMRSCAARVACKLRLVGTYAPPSTSATTAMALRPPALGVGDSGDQPVAAAAVERPDHVEGRQAKACRIVGIIGRNNGNAA